MEEVNIEEQAQKLIERLTVVKDEFIRNKDELLVSVRKDVVASELKDIISKNTDYQSLTQALEVYISNMDKFQRRLII